MRYGIADNMGAEEVRVGPCGLRNFNDRKPWCRSAHYEITMVEKQNGRIQFSPTYLYHPVDGMRGVSILSVAILAQV